MADQSDVTSTTNTDLDSPTQVSFDVDSPPRVSFDVDLPPQVSFDVHSPPLVSFDADSPPHFSFEVEEAGKGKVPDVERGKKQNGGSRLRRCLCTISFICVLCLIIGSIIYFIVSRPPKQVLHTDYQNASLTGFDWQELASKPDPTPQIETGAICPQNWNLYNKKCYLFSQIPVHISDSQEFCTLQGGVPVMSNIMTKDFREFLMFNIRSIIGCCHYQVSVLHNLPSSAGIMEEAINKSLSLSQDNGRNVIDITEQTRSLEPIRATSPHPFYGFWLGSGHDHRSDHSDGHTDQLSEDISNDNAVMTSHGRFDNDTDIPTSHESFHSNADIMASSEGFDSDTDIMASPEGFHSDADIMASPEGFHSDADIMASPEGFHSDADIMASPEGFHRDADMTWLHADVNNDGDIPLFTEDSDQELASRSFHPALSNAFGHAPAVSTFSKSRDPTLDREEADNNSRSARSVAWEQFCEKYENYLPQWQDTDCHGSLVQICERSPTPGNEIYQPTSKEPDMNY